MQKRRVLVSGSSVSKDEELINALEKTVAVLKNSDNRKIQSILSTDTVDAIILEMSNEIPDEVQIIADVKRQFKQVKIILINGDRELFVKAFHLGAKDAFRKPYRRDMLVERVNALLG
jgi:PleD family two-component response regulator